MVLEVESLRCVEGFGMEVRVFGECKKVYKKFKFRMRRMELVSLKFRLEDVEIYYGKMKKMIFL